MSIAQPGLGLSDSRPSPGLPPNLSSNNPFRNRAASPAALSDGQHSPFDPPPRPLSRNPFLDAPSTSDNSFSQSASSPDKMSFATNTVPSRGALTGNAAELFGSLTLNDKPLPSQNTMRMPPRTNTGDKLPLQRANTSDRLPPQRSNTSDRLPPTYTSSSRGENVPPGGSRHRPSRSQEEAMRARRAAGGSSRSKPANELDIFADPSDSPKRSDGRRVRRNSESSAVERKLLSPEEEKKKTERRRRERRERREREARDPKKPDRKLDIIDQLDATSIYGAGLFHHDGPFDACNPHRNKEGSRRAPMQAFPKDSLNNVLGGGGPLNKRPNHSTFLGTTDEEAFKDYSKGGAGNYGYEPYDNGNPQPNSRQPIIESATDRIEPVHGEQTLGLGTSTFLEGAPVSRAALQKREVEQAQTSPTEGGLGRKKSLAQRIRGVNNGSRREYPSGRITSPEGVYTPDVRTPGGSRVPDANPFFNEFTAGDDTKKEGLTIVEPVRPVRSRAPSNPTQPRLERRATSDSTDNSMPPSTTPRMGGGFLSRVKSLKGGPRKPRGASIQEA